MTTALWESQPHLRHVMLKLPPMERLADLTDLKGIIVYLLSEASAYQTAEDVRITGGLHAGRSDTLLNLASLGAASLEK